ncbi:MAG TPA: Fic family protein [Candidatus Paceibacterota bacterium]
MFYKLEKPDLKQEDVKEGLRSLESPDEKMREILEWSEDPQYRHWDTLRHKAVALGIKPEVAWTAVKISRSVVSRTRPTPIRTESGQVFSWRSMARLDAFFHEIDMSLGGTLRLRGVDLNDKYRQEFIARGVMEEAIASSQLEGANTARKVAKRMLLEGRRPGTKSEKMIVNNYRAMLSVEKEYKDAPLSLDMLLRLHVVLTQDTLEDANDAGRIRSGTDDDVFVIDGQGTIYHKGLEPEFVKKELERLISYANGSLIDSKQFTHPVVKAIILHFWIGYLHPFVDGNGRLARLLFYWSLLRDGYWGFAYLPISRVIKESHSQYGMAYVYSEQDDDDFTYFLDYHVRKTEEALRHFKTYVERKSKEHATLRQNLVDHHDLNDRQVRVLQYLHANPDEFISTASYENLNGIAGPTAAKDVKRLVELGFLTRRKSGRTVRYYATSKISSLFQK